MRTCLASTCADGTVIDDYKMKSAEEIDYAKLMYTDTSDPKIKV